ncbi:metallophosphoesterase [Geodermatophilus sp. SYSU D01119]
MRRVAVIGDIGGHADRLREALVDLGMDPGSETLPADLTVVQVGDLVHRGPASAEVLRMVDGFLIRQPEHWVQLAGNHEGLYLPQAPHFPWLRALAPEDQDLLRTWWRDGRMTVAAGLSTDHGDLLVTHAGLTAGVWGRISAPGDVREAVPLLDGLRETDPAMLWAAGRMMRAGGDDPDAGPLWAEAGHEVYPSWLGHERAGRPVPFGQVHGHSSAFDWATRAWRCPPEVAARFVPVRRCRHLRGVIGSRHFAGVDPGWGWSVAGSWSPLVFAGARVVARAPIL